MTDISKPSDNGLDNLIATNLNAKNFYMSLPDYVKDAISQRSGNIKTEDDLKRYAGNLMENL